MFNANYTMQNYDLSIVMGDQLLSNIVNVTTKIK